MQIFVIEYKFILLNINIFTKLGIIFQPVYDGPSVVILSSTCAVAV